MIETRETNELEIEIKYLLLNSRAGDSGVVFDAAPNLTAELSRTLYFLQIKMRTLERPDVLFYVPSAFSRQKVDGLQFHKYW